GDPIVAAGLHALKVREICLVGGAQAIAALAYGTEMIPRVDKIVGPGNAYVAAAKREVFGEVDIDMMAGPTEIVILATAESNPRYIAADMLSQSAHDELARALCFTDSAAYCVLGQQQFEMQLKSVPRNHMARKSLVNYGAIIVT